MTAEETAAIATARPRIRSTWISYLFLSIWAYCLYGLGNATPYLKADLGLTDFQAGLHASALAAGILTAGIFADWLAAELGPSLFLDLSVADLIVAIGLIILAPALPVSLLGALLLGLAGGCIGTYVNVRLGRSGEEETRRLMGRANALSMVMAGGAPVAIGLAATGLHAWRAALLIPVAAYLALSILRPRERESREEVRLPTTSLPGAYWFAWLLLVLVVAIEFSFVFWGSTIVARQTGISGGDSTLLASLFVAGMLVARLAIGGGLGGGRASRGLIAASLCVVVIGASLVSISTIPALSGLGLFVGGLGTAGLWPIGLTVALQTAPKATFQAAARATLATGIAVLLAPSALGLAADAVGVTTAWTIIPGLAIAALIVVAVTPRAH